LPPLYARWMADLLPDPVVGEPGATCSDCAMVALPKALLAASELAFEPTTKCCTFLPSLPNFQVGLALAEVDSPGRATVIQRLHARDAVTPLGLGRSAAFSDSYAANPSWFGRNPQIKCPHYLADGRCGVWKFREATCATWFCKHDRGVVSKKFWRALQRLLSRIEDELSYWCTQQLGADTELVRQIYEGGEGGATIIDASSDPRAVWGPWSGREEELYRAAATLVEPMGWVDVARIAGPGLADEADELVESLEALESQDLPARMGSGEVRLIQIGETTGWVSGYSEFDPRELPLEVLDVIPDVEGLTVEEVQTLAERRGLTLEAREIRELLDFEFLLPMVGD
jgi:hypothetical protein